MAGLLSQTGHAYTQLALTYQLVLQAPTRLRLMPAFAFAIAAGERRLSSSLTLRLTFFFVFFVFFDISVTPAIRTHSSWCCRSDRNAVKRRPFRHIATVSIVRV